jgi:hypothetical protein
MTHILSDTLGQPLVAVVAGVGLGSTLGFLGVESGLTTVETAGLIDPSIMGAVYGGAIGAVPGITMGIAKDVVGEFYDYNEPAVKADKHAHAEAHVQNVPSFLSSLFTSSKENVDEKQVGGNEKNEHPPLSANEKKEYAEYQEFQRWRDHVKDNRSPHMRSQHGFADDAAIDGIKDAANVVAHHHDAVPSPITTHAGAVSTLAQQQSAAR